jgi:hypothetical protein
MLKIPEQLPTQKTNQLEDPGALTYAKDKPTWRSRSTYLRKRQTNLKIPEQLPTQKTNQLEDPGAIT